MTYALAWPLQQAVYELLRADPSLVGLTGDRIYDEPPHRNGPEAATGLYVVIGDETVEPWDTADDRGATHILALSVIAPARGFAKAKQAAGAASEALLTGTLSPNRGRVVTINFVDGRTSRREQGALRRIDLRFRIVLEDDQS